jgi:hypothetical protein
MSLYTTNVDLLALATAFVNQNDAFNTCTATEVEEFGEDLRISYVDSRGYSHEWDVHPVELMAFGWNNPKE